MRKFTITAPDSLTLAQVRAALPGCTVLEVKIRPPRAAAVIDDRPIVVYRNGAPVREIDAVSAQKAINKIMAEVNRGKNSDGRSKKAYPHWGASPDADSAEYARQFCQELHHKPALYVCGFTA
jgi:hypothetical protein